MFIGVLRGQQYSDWLTRRIFNIHPGEQLPLPLRRTVLSLSSIALLYQIDSAIQVFGLSRGCRWN